MGATVTVVMTINKKLQSPELASKWLDVSANRIGWMNPKKVLVDTIESAEDYNDFCMRRIGGVFETDFALVVQMDSFVANPKAWSDEFFDYDYIGAPWKPPLNPAFPVEYRTPYTQDRLVGNGGFSLRSRRLCEKVSEICEQRPDSEGEDVFICLNSRSRLESMGIRFAPYDVARRFSVECDNYEWQFGVHNSVYKNGKLYCFKEMGDAIKSSFLDAVDKESAVDKIVEK